MTLTLTEQYVAQATIYLHNQVLDIQFYSILYKGRSLLVAWDSKNNIITQIFGKWDYEYDDINDLNEIILSKIKENDLTNEEQ